MKKILVPALLLMIVGASCKNSTKTDQLSFAKAYYSALDASDTTALKTLLLDSLLTRETEYDYEQAFSKKGYLEWMKWDAAFDPTYKVLQMAKKENKVEAKVSKIDSRIFFLHEGPIVTNQTIYFEGDKIAVVETTAYEIFDEATFVKNRSALLNWIDENHPELNGFIHDQTETGAKNYLKAIEYFKERP